MTNIYLDIGGVLLIDATPAKHADIFIEYIVTNYNTYWLSTHCQQKEGYIPSILSRYFSEKTMKFIKQVKTATYKTNKSEAIDFSTHFLWFDDHLYKEDKQILIKYGLLDNWIEVNLRKNENQLGKFLNSFPTLIQIIKQTTK